jgi:hypothetical protein
MTILYNVFFLLRRLIFAFQCVFMINYQYAQIQTFMISSVFWIIYIGYYKPYKEVNLNYLEIFNEVCLFLSVYPLFVFTDFVADSKIKNSTGWWLIICTCTNILVNFIILFYKTTILLKLKIKQYLKKRR